jgi:SPP1 family predicted phage head-tail adaptor
MLEAGKLDKQVQLQSPTVVPDADGGQVKAWANVGRPRWAGIRHLSGAEKNATAHGGQVAEARTEITMRYRPGVTEQMRILHKGTAYNIRHVNNWLERNEALILTCDSGVNDG